MTLLRASCVARAPPERSISSLSKCRTCRFKWILVVTSYVTKLHAPQHFMREVLYRWGKSVWKQVHQFIKSLSPPLIWSPYAITPALPAAQLEGGSSNGNLHPRSTKRTGVTPPSRLMTRTLDLLFLEISCPKDSCRQRCETCCVRSGEAWLKLWWLEWLNGTFKRAALLLAAPFLVSDLLVALSTTWLIFLNCAWVPFHKDLADRKLTMLLGDAGVISNIPKPGRKAVRRNIEDELASLGVSKSYGGDLWVNGNGGPTKSSVWTILGWCLRCRWHSLVGTSWPRPQGPNMAERTVPGFQGLQPVLCWCFSNP